MIVIRDASMKVVSRSKNLRGILDYSRRVTVERVDIWPHLSGTAQLGIAWADGATTICDFWSAEVCVRWCKSRRRFPPAIVHQ